MPAGRSASWWKSIASRISSRAHEEFQQLAHDIAMQICATDPRFIRKEDVTPEVLQREKEVLRSQAAATGKPENVLDRIVEGKLGKFYEDNCLYEQHFIKDGGAR